MGALFKTHLHKSGYIQQDRPGLNYKLKFNTHYQTNKFRH